MLNSSRIWCGLIAALVTFVTTPIWGQRIEFPSQIPEGSTIQRPGTGFSPAPAPLAPVNPPPVNPPPANPPPVNPPPILQGPPATFGGTVQPAPTWDPYNPATTAPQSVQPYYAAPPRPGPITPQQPPVLFPGGVPWRQTPGTFAFTLPNGNLGELRRFLKEVRFEYTFLAGDAGNDPGEFDVNTIELSATFAVPFLYNTEAPLLVTPGFAVNYFEGPVTVAPGGPDLPPQVFDAYLDLAWQPIITPWLSADLGFRTGVFSDFRRVNNDSIRYMGRALAVLGFTPTMQVALGVVYLDRNDVKILPAGGLIWRPNPDARYDILFPNPKLAHRMRDIGTTELWWYVGGEFGGGAWTVKRVANPTDQIDYNDIRVILGLEWILQRGIRGHFEVAYVFDREIFFNEGPPRKFEPDDTVMLRGGITY